MLNIFKRHLVFTKFFLYTLIKVLLFYFFYQYNTFLQLQKANDFDLKRHIQTQIRIVKCKLDSKTENEATTVSRLIFKVIF